MKIKLWTIALLGAGLVACVDAENAEDTDNVDSVDQAVGSCVLTSSTVTYPGYIQNKGVCGTRSELIYVSNSSTVAAKIVTTRSCSDLADWELEAYCGEDRGDACYIAHVTSIRVDVYAGPACGSPQYEPTPDDPYNPGGSDNHDDPNYNRNDGCGFDLYGRWTCH